MLNTKKLPLVGFSVINSAMWLMHVLVVTSYVLFVLVWDQLNFDPSEVHESWYWWTAAISLEAIALPVLTIALTNFRHKMWIYNPHALFCLLNIIWFGGMSLLAFSYYTNNCKDINICRNPDCIAVPSPSCGPVYHGADPNFIMISWMYFGYTVVSGIYLAFGLNLRRRVLARNISQRNVSPESVVSNVSDFQNDIMSDGIELAIPYSSFEPDPPRILKDASLDNYYKHD